MDIAQLPTHRQSANNMDPALTPVRRKPLHVSEATPALGYLPNHHAWRNLPWHRKVTMSFDTPEASQHG